MRTDSRVRVNVRFYAAARAAAGAEDDSIDLPSGATVAELVEALREKGPELAKVLARCSYLCDGVAVRDMATELGDTQTVDVLPPFAGG
ncbi:MoaD/ThiS family protein [Mycobacterium sp. Y57]|uniref:MoaD/ThiS family protein n=1 Tax=Mycolicibacterium xanthum TaxID=2796469 RepID=UPI001C855389|nr:MoaD/ThiS family protein [Mycolicibacterium xanthum]MBX7432378.1 MoaD/ThiS family protein [Mycolicibacterium xanthum]